MADLFTKITGESAGSSPYEFNTVTADSGNSFAPSTDYAQAGSYSYKAALAGTNLSAYGIKTFSTASASAYVKAYIYISSAWNYSTSGRYTSVLVLRTSSYAVLSLCVLRPAGQAAPTRWQVYDRANTTTTTTGFSLGAWHKVEMYWQRGTSGNGIARVWIDDNLIHEYTTLTTVAQDAASLRIGSVDDYAPTVACAVYVDEIEGMDAMPSSGSTGGLLVGASALVGGSVLCGQGNLIN